jgi:hypothetical protein
MLHYEGFFIFRINSLVKLKFGGGLALSVSAKFLKNTGAVPGWGKQFSKDLNRPRQLNVWPSL